MNLYLNATILGDGFYISWNSHVKETAIVAGSKESRKYFILKNDHRNELEKLIPKGLESCLQYWRDHQDEISFWSNAENKD